MIRRSALCGMLLGTALSAFGSGALAATPLDQLLKPPATAQTWTIMSSAGKHGSAAIWKDAQGRVLSRESLLLRGQVWEQDQSVTLDANGLPSQLVVHGFTPQGDSAESFSLTSGKAVWTSQVDKGEATLTAPALYIPMGGTTSGVFQLVLEALLARPDHRLSLLPGGEASAEKLASAQVGEGASKKTVILWGVSGLGLTPFPVWATEEGKLFAVIAGLDYMPAGYEASAPILEKAQDDAVAARSPALVKELLKTPSGAVAFQHVRAFVDGQRFAEDQTVVVDKGRITAIGPAASTAVPAGAQIIDGAGKTLSPGLWDVHQHVSDDSAGPMLLALGMTSVRDPGNNNPLTIARAERRAKGLLLSPKVYPSVLIDGKGPNSAQLGTIVTSQDEAVAAVRKAKAEGFVGVKFYGTYNPAWVAPAAAEAHRLGLHVHGHVPAGMRPSQAVASGYDEITHIYFVMMEAMPDAVVATSNGINRFDGTSTYAKDVDLSKGPIRELIKTMAAKGIASDPTLVVVESLFVPENGDLSPSYGPYVGTMPPATERGFRQGGFAVPKGLTRADARKSFDKLVALVGEMHRAGVPVVSGTDGSGLELVRELELYVQAGFTPAEALAAATIVPARLVGADGNTGSIAVGKAADLVLVEGDPSKHIGDLRNTRIVLMDGQLMDADALRKASGFSGRPKM